MDKCHFCERIAARDDIAGETKFFAIMWDRSPVKPGHLIIVPKRHVVSIVNLNEDELKDLGNAIKKAFNIIENTNLVELYKRIAKEGKRKRYIWYAKKMLSSPFINKKPDGYNIGINEGRAAGRTVDHLHIHVIPRHFGDVPDPRGGVRNIFPELGNYKKIQEMIDSGVIKVEE